MTTLSLNKTALAENHEKRGAKLVDFAGWWMPLQFGKVLEEHHAVRNAAGVFDISHMGLVGVSSGNTETTLAALNKIVPQDLSKLYPGKAVYTQLLNEAGGILDDIIIYCLPQELPAAFSDFKEVLVICNASNAELDKDWLRQHLPANVHLGALSPKYSLLALQGPKFKDILGLSEEKLPKRFHSLPAQIENIPVLFARTGYTGEDGVEIIVNSAQVESLWESLIASGATPIGLAARDTLRLEAAYPLHGHDISVDVTPLEAGLGWSVKLDKAEDFIGKAALRTQKEQGLPRKFYCFVLKKKTIARQHDGIFKNGIPVGEVTSGSISPTLNEPIGVGYIQAGAVSGPGDTIQIQVRGTLIEAHIVERPFYKGI